VVDKPNHDSEKIYTHKEFSAKLRRLADLIETEKHFEFQIASARIHVPDRAIFSVEHEQSVTEEEIEFQIRWNRDQAQV